MVSAERIRELAQQAGNDYEQPHNPARTFEEACESIERAIRTALAEQREELTQSYANALENLAAAIRGNASAESEGKR